MSFTHFRARRFLLLLGLLASLAVLTASGALATHGPETEASSGNDGTTDVTPLQNKQNEPTVAINPRVGETNQVSAGQNDNIDLEGCAVMTDNTCPFTDGVGATGFEASIDGGLSFVQPNYTGYSTRHCKGVYGVANDPCTPNPSGPIGTVPNYIEEKLVSDGDPVQTWGPRPVGGAFSWANGSRLYYQNLTSHFQATRDDEKFRGFEAIAVSYTDNFAGARAGLNSAWSKPVIISNAQSQATFSDKNWIAADDAASSPFFGYAHACWVSFRSIGGAPEPVTYARSTDGGVTWGEKKQLSPAANTGLGHGRQGCQVDTDSDGVVYVFYRAGEIGQPENPPVQDRKIMMVRSFDGGVKWERPQPIADVAECGLFDVAQGRRTFDGVAGARTNSFPSVSIANGAPTGSNAPDTIYVTWCHGPTPTTPSGAAEKAQVIWSNDKGESWHGPVNAALPGDRPDFPALAVSPDGTDVYLTYMAFHAPWQSTTASPRTMEGVVVHSNANPVTGAPAGFALAHRGASGDARGSSTNGLVAEFLGDYNSVDAENDFAVAVWNDVRFAADCPTIDTWRQARVSFLLGTGPNPGSPPSVATCVNQMFGNSDIWAARIDDPS